MRCWLEIKACRLLLIILDAVNAAMKRYEKPEKHVDPEICRCPLCLRTLDGTHYHGTLFVVATEWPNPGALVCLAKKPR